MDYIIYFAITIGVLVFIHEFGHFAAAKLCGMRADIFAIGFGKRLLGYNKVTGFSFGELPKDFDGQGNTDYRLSLLPLGGYVKIAGMVDESMDTDFTDKEPEPYEFRAKPSWQKAFVISAGVIMNLLLAWMIFWGANFFHGKPVTNTTTIGYVEDGSKIDSVGFERGDKIVSINGEKVENWEEIRTAIFINTIGEDILVKAERNGLIKEIFVPREIIPDDESQGLFLVQDGVRAVIGDVSLGKPADTAGAKSGDMFLSIDGEEVFSTAQVIDLISSNKGNEVPVKVLRDEDTVSYSVTPGEDGMIGISIVQMFTGDVEYKTYGFFASFYYGLVDIAAMTDLTFKMIGKVFSGDIEFGKAFGGPVKIAQYAAKTADTGIASFLYFLALLSLSLAILNIMPFPVLDGGHLVIILIEGITKKEIPMKVKLAIQQAGLVILLLLMVFIIYNDIISL